jgi:CubicO group peptidase (beta-lactamase class C family)
MDTHKNFVTSLNSNLYTLIQTSTASNGLKGDIMRRTNIFYPVVIGIILLIFNEIHGDITGFWEEQVSENQPFKTVLSFYVDGQQVEGTVFMFQNLGAMNQNKLDNVRLKGDDLFYAISEYGLSFKGKIMGANSYEIKGKITFEDNTDMEVIYRKIDQIKFEEIVQIYKPKQDTTEFVYKQPENINDGWETSNFTDEKVDITEISNVVNNIRKGKHGAVNSFLIIKNGRLILDEYFYGYNLNDLHFLSSATKSVSALITNVAISQGHIKDVHESIFKLMPNCKKYKTKENSAISLENLLNMQLGFELPENDFPIEEDIFAYNLNRKMINSPGKAFLYDNIAPNLLASVIKSTTKQHIDKFAEENIFKPLKIEDYDWEEGKQNGYPICQGTLLLKARDFAKLGYLLLNDGKWQDKQLLSQEWIEKLKSREVTINEEEKVYYGYLFWKADFKSKNETYEVIYAGGSGGQYMFIIPEINSLVLFTGNNYNNHKEFELFEILENQIIPSLTQNGQ